MADRLVSAMLAVLLTLFNGWGYVAPQEDALGPLVLANRQNKAPNLRPELVLPNLPSSKPEIMENCYLQPVAAAALEALFAAALTEEGLTLYMTSGYRSYASQEAIYNRRVDESGDSAKRWVAPPGHSEHQTGLVMDINGSSTVDQGLTGGFGASPEGKWVAENAHRFGFIVRYQQGWEKVTGYGYEPWHLRYVGPEHAEILYERGVPLEEYLLELLGERIGSLLP